MLVKYKMVPSANSNDIIADIRGIITGTITSNSGLSASANASATLFYGTYPTGIYAAANLNSTADTFSKQHYANSSAVCYFRLDRSGVSVANNIGSMAVGQTYNSSTDTLTNYESTAAVSPLLREIGTSLYVSNTAVMPIDIIVNDTMFYISQPTNSNPNQWPGGHIAVTDIDYNSYYKTFSSASPFRLFENYDAVNQPIFKSIWDYKLVDTSGNPSYSYGNGLGTAQWSAITGAYTTDANNNPIIIENQVSVYNPSSGNTVSIIPKIYFMTSSVGFAHGAVYTGADGKYRYVICMGAYSFSVLIS